MRIFDISIPLSPNLLTWPGDPPIKLESLASFEQGDDANVSLLSMSVHSGTHIDAPNHFLASGSTVDHISKDTFFGSVFVMEIDAGVNVINDQVLASHSEIELLKKSTRVLFKTQNSKLWQSHPHTFQKDYVGIDSSGAEFLAGMNFSLIGLDYLSIATYHDTTQPHRVLLSQGVTLLEGINLFNIVPGIYQLFCAPLLIEGCEGAPTRAFLMQ
jgi:arylformamidase